MRKILSTHAGFGDLVDITRTEYFGPGPAPFMINYRVADLDAMLAQLRAAGVPVEDRVEDLPYGRFGWATDPEGNRIELWQPTPAQE